MRVIFTKHARIRLDQRKIGTTKVYQTIIKPDVKSLEEDPDIITYYKKITKNLALKVVTKTEKQKVVIITVYPVSVKKLTKVTPLIDKT